MDAIVQGRRVGIGNAEGYTARQTADGLLRVYCRGNIKHAWTRLAPMALAMFLIAVLADPMRAGNVMVLAVAGEIVNCLLLWLVLHWNLDTKATTQAHALALLAAAVQVSAYSIGAMMIWYCGPTGTSRFVAVIGIGWGIFGAGQQYPYHRSAACLRVAVYLALLLGLFLSDLHAPDNNPMQLGHDAAAAIMFMGLIAMLLRERFGHVKNRSLYERELLKERDAVDQSQLALAKKQHQARQLALVAQNASDSVIISDAEGRIEWVNDTFTQLTGYRPAEVIGKPTTLLNGPDTNPHTVQKIARATRDGLPCRVRILNYNRDGSKIWIETSLTPVFDDDGRLVNYIGIERDVGRSKQRETELARARETAEAAVLAKDAFLATMSHEIRTPMNSVIGMADLLRETPLDSEQETYVDAIADSGAALMTIINDVLDYSKLDAGKLVLENEPFSFEQCLGRVVTLLRPSAETKGLTLEAEITGTLPPAVIGDGGRLRQVLLNLIGNAIKFTETGGIRVGVTAVSNRADCALTIRIADTGIGIPGEQQDHIFENFTQADGTVTRRFGGTGLGLSISRHLTEAMGGTIGVVSKPGVGSTFSVELALPLGEELGISEMVPAPDITGFLPVDVLIAEDNNTNRFLIRKLLRDTGLRLHLARNGVEAVQMFSDIRPAMILMDVSMPLKDGLQATRDIRAIEVDSGTPPVPIVALTANAFDEDRQRCEQAGMDGFLTKPLRKTTLLQQLSAFLEPAGSPPLCQRPGDVVTPSAEKETAHGGHRDPRL